MNTIFYHHHSNSSLKTDFQAMRGIGTENTPVGVIRTCPLATALPVTAVARIILRRRGVTGAQDTSRNHEFSDGHRCTADGANDSAVLCSFRPCPRESLLMVLLLLQSREADIVRLTALWPRCVAIVLCLGDHAACTKWLDANPVGCLRLP